LRTWIGTSHPAHETRNEVGLDDLVIIEADLFS